MGNVQMEADQIRFKNASYGNVQTALSAALTGGGGSTTLAELTDTDITTPSNGQVLTYDGTSEKWENAAIPAQSVDGLSDTNITTPTEGQVLTYDNTSSKWVNATPETGGGVIYPPADTEIEIGTWNGQTLYRRAYYGLNVTGSSSGDTFDLGITIIPGNVKNYDAVITASNNFRYRFNYYSSSTSKFNCYLAKTSETNLLLQVTAYSSGALDLYIDYIKTT